MLGGLVSSHLVPMVQGLLGRVRTFLASGLLATIKVTTGVYVNSTPLGGMESSGTAITQFRANGNIALHLHGNSITATVPANYSLGWSSSNNNAGAGQDLSLNRDAANVLGQRNSTTAQKFNVYNTFTSATSYERLTADWQASANTCLLGTEKGSGGGTLRPMWTIGEGGKKTLTADVANATTTFSNLTDLSITLLAGRKYTGRIVVKCNNSVAAEGIKFDFNGGGATMTSFWAAVNAFAASGTVTPGTTISTSLAGVLNYTTITGETVFLLTLSMVVNAGGTFTIRFAENSTATGTATVELGSFTQLEDSV